MDPRLAVEKIDVGQPASNRRRRERCGGRTVGDGTLTAPFASFIQATPVGRHGPPQATIAMGHHEAAPTRRSKSACRLLSTQGPEIACEPEPD
jgi:hypothetical protein